MRIKISGAALRSNLSQRGVLPWFDQWELQTRLRGNGRIEAFLREFVSGVHRLPVTSWAGDDLPLSEEQTWSRSRLERRNRVPPWGSLVNAGKIATPPPRQGPSAGCQRAVRTKLFSGGADHPAKAIWGSGRVGGVRARFAHEILHPVA